MFTLIIPSCNEENYIGACLAAVQRQSGLADGHGIEIIVAANACTDGTVEIARAAEDGLRAAGFDLQVLDIGQPGKMNALNLAEAAARHPDRVCLDADVIIAPTLLAEMAAALDRPTPVYVSGTVVIPRSPSWVTRAYARVWSRLPFVAQGVPGIGLYAFNAAGRARWGEFPQIYSDDRFVRLQFAPRERVKLAARYEWPLPAGFANLVRVRRRWSEGNDELREKYPDLMVNDSQRNRSLGNALSLLKTPASSAVFVAVYLAGSLLAKTRARDAPFNWRRGRV